ncbi:MAG: hypothetical protein AAF598_04675, partial [Bacteroidota bacterium]
SKYSLESKWVKREIALSQKYKKTIFPLLIGDVSDEDFPKEIKGILCGDFRNEKAYTEELLKTLRSINKKIKELDSKSNHNYFPLFLFPEGINIQSVKRAMIPILFLVIPSVAGLIISNLYKEDPNPTVVLPKKDTSKVDQLKYYIDATGRPWLTKPAGLKIKGSTELESGGTLYTYSAALKVCQQEFGEGCRLPNDSEWKALAMELGGYFNYNPKKKVGNYEGALKRFLELFDEGTDEIIDNSGEVKYLGGRVHYFWSKGATGPVQYAVDNNGGIQPSDEPIKSRMISRWQRSFDDHQLQVLCTCNSTDDQ